MKNLFIVNTPYHLLTAFILAKSIYKTETNYLLALRPHAIKHWQQNTAMRYMASEGGGFDGVLVMSDWFAGKARQSFKEQAAAVKEKFAADIDNIFMSIDLGTNQLVLPLLGRYNFYRFEDGLYSYYNGDRHKSLADNYFHRSKLYVMKWLAGIGGRVYFNVDVAGGSRTALADYLYWPELLRRESPGARAINTEMIAAAAADLRQQGLLTAKLTKRSIIYLSQPLEKRLPLDKELVLLRTVCEQLPEDVDLLYKPHPNDGSSKLDFYRDKLPQMKPYTSITPIEVSFFSEQNIIGLISYQSTALMTAAKFAAHKIGTISLAEFYTRPLDKNYKEILAACGAVFPTTEAELSTAVRQITA